jgi:hypothetical protein
MIPPRSPIRPLETQMATSKIRKGKKAEPQGAAVVPQRGSSTTNLLIAILVATALAAAALILGSRQTREHHDACIAAHGTPTYDHDGFRCMRDGAEIEVSP